MKIHFRITRVSKNSWIIYSEGTWVKTLTEPELNKARVRVERVCTAIAKKRNKEVGSINYAPGILDDEVIE